MSEETYTCAYCNRELTEDEVVYFADTDACADCCDERTAICECCRERI